MSCGGDQALDSACEWLRDLIVAGRRYEIFARDHPAKATNRIAELNAPGLEGQVWDLQWIPPILRARIARAASALTLHFCRSLSPTEDQALMDILMPTAIVTACVVADAHGVPNEIPSGPLPAELDRWARLLSAVLEPPQRVETYVGGDMAPEATVESRIGGYLPPQVRSRLIRLAELMRHSQIWNLPSVNAVIFLIGAVAADRFGTLNVNDV